MWTGSVGYSFLVAVLMLAPTMKGQIYDYGLDRRGLYKATKVYKDPSFVFPWSTTYADVFLRGIRNMLHRKRNTSRTVNHFGRSMCFGCCNHPPCWYRNAVLCRKCRLRV